MSEHRTATETVPDKESGDQPSHLHIDEARVTSYLERIGAARPGRPDAAHLRDLQFRHVRTVPFENLGIHAGEQIALDARSLVDKIARERRGGICYESNGAFAALLTTLGYRVSLLSARVFLGDGFGPPFDHLALRVDAEGEPYLVDVGFGRQIEFPLRLDDRAEQRGPGGVYRIEDGPDGDLDVYRDGVLQYRVELRPRALSDFTTACWWHSNAPQAHFTQNLVCSLPTENGRVTISGQRLVITDGGHSSEVELPQETVLEAYRDHFGIVLDRMPELLTARPAGV
ncbi:arylamine N-acetyltransferase family protein [Streptomyces cadmiisoli]|uniref:arylamine N-acetyltransferase family protein n=1 Tax=Streptomyces cadmiisoli TaxID=2184053 RepID=UPI003662F47C